MDRYEEALERARAGMPIDEVFPELKESEDERIRKALIKQFSAISMETWAGIPKTDIISYLERQKEQKSLNISAASEWLREHVRRYINSEYNEFHKCVEYDGSIDKERLINDFEEAMQKEQNPAEWSEEDEAKKERLISIVKRALHGNEYPILNDNGATELITWLKSLRPQPKVDLAQSPKENTQEANKTAIGRV